MEGKIEKPIVIARGANNAFHHGVAKHEGFRHPVIQKETVLRTKTFSSLSMRDENVFVPLGEGRKRFRPGGKKTLLEQYQDLILKTRVFGPP